MKKGWLNAEEYGPVVNKAGKYLDEDGNLRNVSQGTNIGDNKE